MSTASPALVKDAAEAIEGRVPLKFVAFKTFQINCYSILVPVWEIRSSEELPF